MGQLVLAHATTKPASLRRIDQRIPAQVDDWFERALARDPDARFSSASEMAETFERAVLYGTVKSTGVLPRSDSRTMRLRESSRYSVVPARERETSEK